MDIEMDIKMAVERLKLCSTNQCNICGRYEKEECMLERNRCERTVLNELEKKDLIINEMAKEIADITGSCPYDKYDYDLDCGNRCKHDREAECWKEYFTNKVTDTNVGE